MRKLTRFEMKNLIGGKHANYHPASCGVECSDGEIHNYDCGNYGCNSTTSGQIECYNDKGTVVSTNNPCPLN